MAHGLYESILEELGRALKIVGLQPDEKNTCLIKFPTGLEVYVEQDKKGPFLIISSNLGTPQLGKYRNEIFKAALIANGAKHPLHGILCFSNVIDQLIIFEKISLQDITGDRVYDRMVPFMEKALRWKEALDKNEIPPPEYVQSRSPIGLFGIR